MSARWRGGDRPAAHRRSGNRVWEWGLDSTGGYRSRDSRGARRDRSRRRIVPPRSRDRAPRDRAAGSSRRHRVEPVLHDVAFLLRDDAAELQGTDLGDRLHTEIVRRDRRRDEARRRRLERHIARFDAAQDLVLQPFVPDVQVVVGIELPLAVKIHVDVQPLADDAPRADRILRIRRDRRESGVASRQRRLLLLRRAAQVAELVRLELEPQIEVHAELGGTGRRGGGYDGRREGRGGYYGRRSGGEQRTTSCQHLLGPRAREQRGRDARTQAAAGRQRRIARRDERRHAKRGSLRRSLGYADDREGGANYLREEAQPMNKIGCANRSTR